MACYTVVLHVCFSVVFQNSVKAQCCRSVSVLCFGSVAGQCFSVRQQINISSNEPINSWSYSKVDRRILSSIKSLYVVNVDVIEVHFSQVRLKCTVLTIWCTVHIVISRPPSLLYSDSSIGTKQKLLPLLNLIIYKRAIMAIRIYFTELRFFSDLFS